MGADLIYTCGSCGAEMRGYNKSDIEAEGWKPHAIKNGVFWMCGECQARYAPLWEAAA